MLILTNTRYPDRKIEILDAGQEVFLNFFVKSKKVYSTSYRGSQRNYSRILNNGRRILEGVAPQRASETLKKILIELEGSEEPR